MPRASWGVKAADVDEFDRDSQFKPYAGPPVPVNEVYLWNIKVLKYAAKTGEKFPQLRVGLELVPREGYDEDKYEGYFTMAFLTVSPKTQWKYVPFLDCIGVSGSDFEKRTFYDEDGNIKKIGSWKMTGDDYLLGQLKWGEDAKGEPRKEIGAMMPFEGEMEEDEDDEEYYEDEDE